MSQKLFLLFPLLFNLSLLADPPQASHHYWQNSNFVGHYVLYDYGSRTYLETINCKVAYRFTVVSNIMNTLTLFDASRGMTVQLNYEGMSLKEKGATKFTFYQQGSFDTREQFKHYDNKGNFTGALTKQHACGWVEYLAGSHAPDWRFVEVGRNKDFVDLYDASRNMTVRLEKNRMLLKTGNNPLGFFKNGNW